MENLVGIVSYFSKGAFAGTENEDQILSSILTDLEINHEIVAWSDQNADWSKFSLLLIKSPWDYFDYYSDFLDWIKKIKELNIPVLNSLESLVWNSNKNYLIEIENKGFNVISGKLLPEGEKIDWTELLEDVENTPFIIKPLVSGGAKNTFKVDFNNVEEIRMKMDLLIRSEGFIAQPFVREIEEVGEYSLVFFNSVYSHAVLKSPANADFRVQHFFGGKISVIEPSESLIKACQRYVDEFCKDSLYVRVDGVLIQGDFHLMELEMIEPYLFLSTQNKALKNYKDALRKRLSSYKFLAKTGQNHFPSGQLS